MANGSGVSLTSLGQSKKKKGEGKRLTDAQRYEILTKHADLRQIEVARRYSISSAAVKKLRDNKSDVIARYENGHPTARDSRKRGGDAAHKEFEEELYKWVCALRARKVPLPPTLVRHRAIQKAKDIPNFSASVGWFYRFCKRYNLECGKLHGEGGDVDLEDPELLKKMQRLCDEVLRYGEEYVYNMDESGLFYRMIPQYSILCAHEAKEARGQKQKKERVTLILCCNASGTHKIPMLIVGKAKKPACFNGKKPPVPYCNQDSAWCDFTIFRHWCNTIFIPEIKLRTGRLVLLLMDNAPGHFAVIENGNIRSEVFPPNVTSHYQPLDQGIIAAVKKRYKFSIFMEILSFHDKSDSERELLIEQGKKKRGTAGIAFGKPPTLLDAIEVLKEAWDAITTTTIQNCWRKSTLLPPTEAAVSFPEDDNGVVAEMSAAFSQLCQINSDVGDIQNELNDWLHVDDKDSETMQMVMFKSIENLLNDEICTEGDCDEDSDDGTENVDVAEWLGVESIYNSLCSAREGLDHPDATANMDEKVVTASLEAINSIIRQVHRLKIAKKTKQSKQFLVTDFYST